MVLLLLRWVVRRPGHAGAGVSTMRAATASPKDKRSTAPSVPMPTPRATPAHIRGSGTVGVEAAPSHRVQAPLGGLAHRARGDDEQLVAVPQHVVVARHE